MRKIAAEKIFSAAKKLIATANFHLPAGVQKGLLRLKSAETTPAAAAALDAISRNFKLSEKTKIPLCQDTGTAIFLVKIGHRVALEEPIFETLFRATASAYRENFLRASIVGDPLFDRKNTKNNCPPIVKIKMVAGENLEIIFLPKGGGAENKSVLKMLRPADGVDGVARAVVDAAKNAGGAACPPWIVGVGVGGTFDTVADLAKTAILRDIDTKNENPKYAALETKIAAEIEKLKIGALGFGGKKTVLAVHIVAAPTHIASLPVAVNFQCHSARSAKIIL